MLKNRLHFKLIKMIPLVLVLISCSSLIFEKEGHPIYYTVEYKTEHVNLPRNCRKKTINLTIWDFDSSVPYNTTRMIVIKKHHRIERSYKHQWIREPALLLKDKLAEDIEHDGFLTVLIPKVYTVPHQVDLMGKVKKWAWVELEKGEYRAEISVFIQAWREKDKELIFKKSYLLKGPRTNINNSDAFANQINQLVKKLSTQLRGDLYKVICKKSKVI